MKLSIEDTNRGAVDFLRWVSCIAVVIIHVTAAYFESFIEGSFQYDIVRSINILARFAVPSFLAISGYVMYLKYGHQDFDFKKHLIKGTQRMLIPYLIYSSVYLVYYHFYYDVALSVSNIVSTIITGTACYHLYYLILAMQFYLLLPVFIKIYKVINNPYFFSIIVLLVSAVVHKYIHWQYQDRFFLFYIIFYCLGIVLADIMHHKRITKIWIKVTIAIIYLSVIYIYLRYYLVIGSSDLWRLYSVISIVVLYLIGRIYSRWHKPIIIRLVISSMVKLSFTIYLIHPLIMDQLHRRQFFLDLTRASLTFALIAEFLIVLLGAWLISWLIHRVTIYGKNNMMKMIESRKV